MAKRIKFEDYKSNVADAISNAFSAFAELGEECREIVDNASAGLSETTRIQTLGETADALEELHEPDIPDWLGPTEVEYQTWKNARKGRSLSRADRCGEACAILEKAIEVLEAELEDADSDKKPTIESLRDTCVEAKDAAEGCEFPGMYG